MTPLRQLLTASLLLAFLGACAASGPGMYAGAAAAGTGAGRESLQDRWGRTSDDDSASYDDDSSSEECCDGESSECCGATGPICDGCEDGCDGCADEGGGPWIAVEDDDGNVIEWIELEPAGDVEYLDDDVIMLEEIGYADEDGEVILLEVVDEDGSVVEIVELGYPEDVVEVEVLTIEPTDVDAELEKISIGRDTEDADSTDSESGIDWEEWEEGQP